VYIFSRVPKTSGVGGDYLGNEKTSSALLWNIQSPKTTLLERQKGLQNTFLRGLQMTPSLKAKRTSNPHGLPGRCDQPFILQPCKFQQTCWWLLAFASSKTETSLTCKTQDDKLSTGGAKSSQVFLLTSRPFHWHCLFSKKEKILQTYISAFPAVRRIQSRSELASSDIFKSCHTPVKRHVALDLFL